MNGSTKRSILVGVILVTALFTSVWANAADENAIEEMYNKAKQQVIELEHSPNKRKFRHNWFKVIKAFDKIHKKYPNHKRGIDAAFTAARLWQELARFSGLSSDLKKAQKRFLEFYKQYPKHRYSDDALFFAASIYEKLGDKQQAAKLFAKIVKHHKSGAFLRRAKQKLAKLGIDANSLKEQTREEEKQKEPKTQTQPTQVSTNVSTKNEKQKSKKSAQKEHKENATPSKPCRIDKVSTYVKDKFTRAVRIDMSHECSYRQGEAEKSDTKPKRFFIDIYPATPAPKLKSNIPVKSSLIGRIRIGRFDKTTVRVVLDLKDETCTMKIEPKHGSKKKFSLIAYVESGNKPKLEPKVEAKNPKQKPQPKKKEQPVQATKESKPNIAKKEAVKVQNKTPKLQNETSKKQTSKPTPTKQAKKQTKSTPQKNKAKKKQPAVAKPKESTHKQEQKTPKIATKQQPSKPASKSKEKEEKESKEKKTAKQTESKSQNQKKEEKESVKKPQRQEAKGLKVVVIDPGHGGKDFGAIGKYGTREKDITLKIARKLKKKLERKIKGIKVILTRNKDKTMKLKERTDIANKAGADLFVSIHCNATLSRKHHGVETYFLNMASHRYAERLAKRENESAGGEVNELSFILADLATTANTEDSIRAARYVQMAIIRTLKRRGYSHIKDRGINSALFFVLLHARMPSILVETSFISNPREEKRLRSPKYQDAIAEGIAKGIVRFHKYLKSVGNQTRIK